MQRSPGDKRYGERVGMRFLDSLKNERVLLVFHPTGVVVVHAVLVGPDAGHDARPTRSADRVVFLIPLSKNLRIVGVSPLSD